MCSKDVSEKLPQFRMRAVGFYVPPVHTDLLKAHMLEMLGQPAVQPGADQQISSFTIGDFNVPGWSEEYHEWCASEGLWELNDPFLPTHTGGRPLDRILFAMGDFAPSNFIVSSTQNEIENEGDDEIQHFLATVHEEMAFSDHSPIILQILADKQLKPKLETSFKLERLAGEDGN